MSLGPYAGIPPEKRQILDAAVAALARVPHVVAVVLGGSYARGFADEASDLDLGVYYRESAPFAIHQVREVAASLCTPGSVPVVTDFYGWGPWVNGGAWIQTPATKVDLIYRNLDHVQRVIEEGCRGVSRHDYDQQPPFGFRSVVYFGETHYCVPLHDPHREVAALQQSVAVYPAALKTSLTVECLWGAEFSLWAGDRFAASADVYNLAGCLTRAAHFLVHALFALNELYFLNDKHVNRILPTLSKAPPDCAARLGEILAHPGGLHASLDAFRQLWIEAVALTDGLYQPRFDLTAAQSAGSNA